MKKVQHLSLWHSPVEMVALAKKLLQTTVQFLVLFCTFLQANATTYPVTNLNDAGAGSLRQAILDANGNAGADVIDATGVTGTILLTTGQYSITDGVIITGPGANLLTLSGNNSSRVFFINEGVTANINDLTITGGKAAGPGNSNNWGGGIFVFGGILNLNNAVVTNNTAYAGGGIYVSPGSTTASAKITNSTISNNPASYGGGIIAGSNSISCATLTITNSTISGNSAIEGGGITLYCSGYGPSTLTNCTVSGNTATGTGGGFYNQANLTLINTIVANSTGGDIANVGGTTNAQYSLIEDGLGSVNGTNSNNLTGDPNLGPLANNSGTTPTHALLAGSTAIDKGSAVLGMTTDQRGFGRPVDIASISNADNGSDIGAYEYVDPCTFFTNNRAYVNASATGANNGTSWTDAFTDIQSALAITGTCGITQIWVAAGTYKPDEGSGQINNSVNSTFALKNGVAIYGGFAGGETVLTTRNPKTNLTVLSGDIDNDNTLNATNATHVVTGSGTNNTALLDGFSIIGGYAPNSGFGGGMYNLTGSPTVNNCIFSGNFSHEFGGGMANYVNASPIVTNCIFSGNSTTITAVGAGGGMANLNTSNPTVINCIFTGNLGDNAGGMYNAQSSPLITNCTFTGNSALVSGGGLYNNGGTPVIKNCIFWNNKDQTGTGTATASVNGPLTAITYSLVQAQNPAGAGNLDGTNAANDPLFVTAVDPTSAPATLGDLHLQSGSTAINSGTNAGAPATDIEGNIRLLTAANPADMGAYEVQTVQCTNDPIVTNSNDAGPGSLRKAILDACPGSTITFDMNTVVSPINLTSGQLVIDKNLTIQGPGATLLDIHNNANNYNDGVNFRVLYIGNVTASILGIRISGGFLRESGSDGAGILNNGNLTITNCTISENTISGSTNKGYYGSGAGISNGGTLTINNSIIEKNSIGNTSADGENVGGGSGIANGGAVIINNSTISDNGGDTQAGGIQNGGTMNITNSTIWNNSGGAGGISQLGGSLTIINSTISGNTGINGGGISYWGGSTAIKFCTITGNNGYGGGIYNHQYSLSGAVAAGVFTISNSILAGNSGPYDNMFGGGFSGDYYFPHDPSIPTAGFANLTSLGNNILGNVNEPLNWTFKGPGDQLGIESAKINPLLGPLADNGGPTKTHALLAGSPAVNAGNNTLAVDANNIPLATDQRETGFPRIGNGGSTVDIGAFEADNTTMPLLAVANTYSTVINTTISRNSADLDDLLDNDNFGSSPAAITSFGGGSLGGTVTTNAAGASVALAGGSLKVNSDGSFSLTTPTVTGNYTFQYRITNLSGTSDATVTIKVNKYCPPAGSRWYVSAAAGPDGSGTSWDCAFQSVQQALAAAGPGHEIWVAAGTYTPTSTADRSKSFQMKNDVAIYGGFNGTETALSQRNWVANPAILSGDIGTPGDNGDNSYNVISNDNNNLTSTAILDGFTITGGNCSNSNSGIYGGGMYNNGQYSAMTPIVRNCIFTGNTALSGGAVGNVSGSPKFINCIFRNNSALDVGDAYTGLGGAIHNYVNASPVVINCTFYGNTAQRAGGAIFNIYGSNPIVTNCIVWGNNTGVVNDYQGSATINYSIVQGGCPVGATCATVLNADPNFVGTSNLHLQPGSPAINAGTNSGAPSTDFEGTARPLTLANPADMGAYEFQAPAGPNSSVLSVSGPSSICKGTPATIKVDITGGTSPYTVVYSDGTNNFTVSNYTSGDNIPVSPNANTTYSLVSVTDAGSNAGTGNSSSAIITVTDPPTWYLDADGDGYYVSTIQSCVSPGPGYTSTQGISGDCDDGEASVWRLGSFYLDADGDGYGRPGAVDVCYGNTTPQGWSTNNTDCNDNDRNYYQLLTGYADADGDGYTSGGAQQVCSGATLPSGWLASRSATDDCNDGDASAWRFGYFYNDNDRDGYGNTNGDYVCFGNSTPIGWSINNTDCNDNDKTVWKSALLYIDADGDGYDAGTATVCYGAAIPAGYSATTLGSDCNDNNPSVQVPPAVSAGSYGPVCSNSSLLALGGSPAGGTWTGTGVSGSVGNFKFNPAAGSQTLTYTSSNGCSSSAQTSITVNAAPAVSAGSYGQVCSSSGLLALGGSPGGGTWSGIGVSGSAGAFKFDPTSGTQTLTYTYSNGTCSNSAQATVNVNAAPNATILSAASVCSNSTGNTASVAAVSGATYVWTINYGTITYGNGTNSILYTASEGDDDFNADDSVKLSVTVTSSAGCKASSSKQLYINPLPKSTITAASAVCAGSTGNTASVTSGVNSYLWTIANGTITSSTTINSITYSAGTSGTVKLSVTVTRISTGCKSYGTKSVTIVAAPNAAITAASPVCSGSTGNVASVASAGSGATYVWTISNGTITSGNGSSSIKYTSGVSGSVTLNVTVKNSTGCISKGSKSITVTSKATPLFAAIGPLCQNATAPSLPTTSTNGVSGSWSPSKISTSSTGTKTYTFTPASGQCAVSITRSITVQKCTNTAVKAAAIQATSIALDAILLPNPTSTQFTLLIKGNRKEVAEIRVFDLLGRSLERLKANTGEPVLFGGNYVKGMYIVEVLQGTERKVLKALKQ